MNPLSGTGRMMETTLGYVMLNKLRLRVRIEARTRVRAPGELERQLEESEWSRMELERFVRLEWPRTENESPFLSIPS